jgi:hypothetical protein
MPYVDNTWPWPGSDEPGYLSAPQSQWETARVRCPTCGGAAVMPMEGPAPLNERGDIDWDRLLPIMLRFARTVLAPQCRYAETMRHA